MKIECKECGKVLEDDDKVIILSESSYWDGNEDHTFFCCKLHASEYMWAIARRNGVYNPNPGYSFWFRTVEELKNEIIEYEFEQFEQEQDLENEEAFFDDEEEYEEEYDDEDDEIVCEQCGKVLADKDKVILVKYLHYEPICLCSDRCYSLFIFRQTPEIAKKFVVIDSTADRVVEVQKNMKLRNDKEIIVGKTNNRMYMGNTEIPFFVGDIKQLCFNPYENTEYKYSVLINTALTDENAILFITKEKYDYLQKKLGANDDE